MDANYIKNDDYGYLGKGSTGYAHYMQAFNESQKGGGGGGQPPQNNSGCLVVVVATVIIAALIIDALLLPFLLLQHEEWGVGFVAFLLCWAILIIAYRKTTSIKLRKRLKYCAIAYAGAEILAFIISSVWISH